MLAYEWPLIKNYTTSLLSRIPTLPWGKGPAGKFIVFFSKSLRNLCPRFSENLNIFLKIWPLYCETKGNNIYFLDGLT